MPAQITLRHIQRQCIVKNALQIIHFNILSGTFLFEEIGRRHLLFIPGNNHTFSQQWRRLRSLTQLPEMAQAMAAITPQGMGRNKQIVADFLRRRQFRALALLYRLKNRNK